MPESRWQILTPDGKTIYGVLNESTESANRKAVIHIHGLTGNPYEVAQTLMAQEFPKRGYDVIRPYLYSSNSGARNLTECTIKIHAKDINTISRYFSDKYDELFATGHSYGGPSLMCSRHDAFTAMSLWDPSYDPTLTNVELAKLGDFYVMGWGTDILMGQAMYQEKIAFNSEYSRSLSAQCLTPLQVITAADGFWAKYDESFNTHTAGPSERVTIEGTRHCFYEEGTTQQLLNHTKRWFDQFSKI